MLNFEDIEGRDSVHLLWNRFIQNLPPVSYKPVTCNPPCCAVLNPYRQINIRGKLRICPFCLTRNAFPPHYKDIPNTDLPPELLPKYMTVEHMLSHPAQAPPVFLFVVDTFGLITFGTMTQVHKLGYVECSESYVFRGGKEYMQERIRDMLGLSTTTRSAPHAGQPMPQQASGAARFLLPVQQCEFQLTGILEALAHDPWPVANDKRALRTGVAINVAIGLLETTFPNTGARIMVFAGGPAMKDPGMVVSNELKEPISSHHNIKRASVTAQSNEIAKASLHVALAWYTHLYNISFLSLYPLLAYAYYRLSWLVYLWVQVTL
ncbi:hypothetical protein BD769DRAFT_1694878 [Suillus cothurnatus]|nr:hypothetical protein BD769DRAFT_1694878 [Suillus cothurnatus]